ncbi:MAG TPA: hypothetical protein GXX69_07480 [Firmicutes bacterium]|nr:hypothetical protein [Bacillota bacterium]
MGVNMVMKKPLFSSDQIVNVSEVQRKWKSVVEPKLNELPFVMMFSGSEPKATILSYDNFEELWQKVNETAELQLKLELAYRIIEQEVTKSPLLSLADVVSQTDLTAEDLAEAPDVEIDAD